MRKIYFFIFGLISFAGTAQIVNIPDANFKAKLIALGVDANNDSQISVSEAANQYAVDVSNSNITDLTGISAFTNLQYLSCDQNALTFLDASGLANLIELSCSRNQITTLNLQNPLLTTLICSTNAIGFLDLSGLPLLEKLWASENNLSNISFYSNPNLNELDVSDNNLTSIDVNYLSQLTQIHVGGNQLTSLQVNSLTNLISLQCWPNNITAIDVSNLTHLFQLDMRGNDLTSLDVTHNLELAWLFVAGNQLTSIDLSANYNLTTFYCHSNPLATINISNLANLTDFQCGNDAALQTIYMKNGKTQNISIYSAPNLQYICADESEVAAIQAEAGNSVTVNSYCTFTPGGTYYILRGNLTSDLNNNGCDSEDAFANDLKFNVDGNFIFLPTRVYTPGTPNNEYFIPLTVGTHVVQPVLENPTYFQANPASITVDFPSQGSPLEQDFCIAPFGIHSDIETIVLALDQPRPGFSSHFKILVRNKGNQVISSAVAFNFNPLQADFSNASQTPETNNPGALTFSFSNLQPFGETYFDVTLIIHSPSQSDPVVGGDILSVSATCSISADETPLDNTFVLHQTVVNSFDPNDKICLEGATITPEMVGKYVHYMIRFENTGTANAQNIVVKDMIDTAKFDLSSLVPLDGSHPFLTRTSGNKVEFIFENINLPFDDANNDGYVAFKIKTKPTLVLGDTFSNTASIYFDYNFPIVTEPAVTAIAVLAKQDFAFDSYFRIYPNPASDVLKIESKQNIEVQSISIYNTLGQMVLVVPNAKTTKAVDVSALQPGNYLIKIDSDKGTSNAKFIKS